MVSTQDSESCDPSSNLGRTFSFCFYVLNLETDQEDLHQRKQNIRRARPGFEPGTSRTLSENHTPRPTSQVAKWSPCPACCCLEVQDWPCGPTDKASDYESGDCRFESCQGQYFFCVPALRTFFPNAVNKVVEEDLFTSRFLDNIVLERQWYFTILTGMTRATRLV